MIAILLHLILSKQTFKFFEIVLKSNGETHLVEHFTELVITLQKHQGHEMKRMIKELPHIRNRKDMTTKTQCMILDWMLKWTLGQEMWH